MSMETQYPSFVREEIENWIAWSWSGESPEPREPSRCYSAERSYHAPHSHSDEIEDVPPKVIFNAERAARVQQLFDQMPMLARRVLQYEYTHRTRYDQWERSHEMHEGEMRPVWIRVSNNKRHMARIRLKVSRDEYVACLDQFKVEVFKEFECEVCA